MESICGSQPPHAYAHVCIHTPACTHTLTGSCMHTGVHTQLLKAASGLLCLLRKQPQSLPQMTNVLSEEGMPCPPFLSSSESPGWATSSGVTYGQDHCHCIYLGKHWSRHVYYGEKIPQARTAHVGSAGSVRSCDTGRGGRFFPLRAAVMSVESCDEHGWKLPTGAGWTIFQLCSLSAQCCYFQSIPESEVWSQKQCACVYMCVCSEHGSHRIAWRKWFSPSTTWDLGIELRKSNLAASTFVRWAILPVPSVHIHWPRQLNSHNVNKKETSLWLSWCHHPRGLAVGLPAPVLNGGWQHMSGIPTCEREVQKDQEFSSSVVTKQD